MSADIVIVDMQGFKDFKNQFILKEFAILINGCTQTFLVKPPYSFTNLSSEEKKRVRWLENNRGIYWSEGFIDYREFKRTIRPYLKNKKILVKGLEKIKWIESLHENCEIVELGENGCPNFLKLSEVYGNTGNLICVHHNKICALKNVNLIEKWCKDNNFSLFLSKPFGCLNLNKESVMSRDGSTKYCEDDNDDEDMF